MSKYNMQGRTGTNVLILLFLTFTLSNVNAGSLPPELERTWEVFREGIARNDADKVASVSRFPIHSNEPPGDIPSEKMLKRKFHIIFVKHFRKCLAETRPEPDPASDDYIVNCGGVFFGFRRNEGKYRFAYIDNVNE